MQQDRRFPEKNSGDLRDWCLTRLSDVEIEAAKDPMTNGVRRLAFDLSEGMQSGAVTDDDLAKVVKSIADDAIVERARDFANTHRLSGEDIAERVRQVLSTLEGKPFAHVREVFAQTRAGVVFTAHPTFANGKPVRDAFGVFASDGDEEKFRSALKGLPHSPPPDITLHDEHDEVLERIALARDAIRLVIEAMVNWSREAFPDQWRALVPQPISLATWVGYDLDGRTDIHWAATFQIRLAEKAERLSAYAVQLKTVAKGHDKLNAIVERLEKSAELVAEQAALFSGDLNDPAVVVKAANHLTADHADRLVNLSAVIDDLAEIISNIEDDDCASALSVLRAEMTLYGLGAARIHLRVNAAQVRSTLQSDLGFAPGQAFADRTALDAAALKSAEAATKSVNFASVFREKMTARRQLMLCAQFIKHVDAETPIRFLIAECEAPATIMGAVYLARLYGVDHLVDISPLFETREALESGGRFMERLLDEPEFVRYIRNRKRIAIQLGFSDSGRFMGQIAADMAIERLHILLCRELTKRDIKDVEVLLFNTHGESMGRGGFPGSLTDRFDHLLTPWTRSRYAHDGLRLNAESSFQGGDGFLHFQTEALARATVGAVFDWAYAEPQKMPNDRFYQDINFSWDVYRAVKDWQEALFADPNYQTALSAFAFNFLPKTGSRKTKRQSGASKNDAARSLRAIPHNAILQQLAVPADIFGGLGSAAYREPERFDELVQNSRRMRELMRMALHARQLTGLSILRSYASLYSPDFWTVRARHAQDSTFTEDCTFIADVLTPLAIDSEIGRLANFLSVDRRKFDDIQWEKPAAEAGLHIHRELYVLHAIRMAYMMRAFLIVAATPSFSGRHEITKEALLAQAFNLDLSGVADALAQIFPMSGDGANIFSDLTEREDDQGEQLGYPEIHKNYIEPLRQLGASIKEISVAIAHYYGAYG